MIHVTILKIKDLKESSTNAIDPCGQLISQPITQYKIQDIERLTDAFNIFMSIYKAAHPDKKS